MTDHGADYAMESEQPPDDFDALISHALERLPDEFRRQLDSVAIVVDDYPTPAQLDSTHAYGLFGIYEGVPRTAYGAYAAAVPSKITLFRGTLADYNPSPDALAQAVEDTLFHEIAHHFGISDARLRELARERPPSDWAASP